MSRVADGERRHSSVEWYFCLATRQAYGADLLVAARLADDDLDVAPQPQQDANEPIGREAAQLPIEQQRNLRASLTRLVRDLHLRHVPLVDDALNLGEQVFLPDERSTNPRLRAAPLAFCCAHPDPAVDAYLSVLGTARNI